MSTATLHIENKKALAPQLRFPEFVDEWIYTNLGEAFSIFNGYAFSSTSSVEEGVLWVKIADVGIQEMKNNNLSFLPISLKEKHKKFILKKGDFVVALTRPILNGKLKIAKINDFFDGALLNQRVGKIVSTNSHYFIFSLLQKTDLIKSIENNIAGSDPPNLSPNEINFINISIPTLPEQQKIASFLSAVDEKIQQLSRKKELLEQYKKGVMQQLFSGKLRFKDENGNNYADWEERKLADFCTFFSGGTPTSTNQKFYSGRIPFIGSGNIYDSEVFNFISEEALNSSSSKIIEKGDLLYALYGANSGELAISKMNGAINQAILCIRNEECIEYLYYVLLLNKDNIVAKFLQGGQGNLSSQIIKRLKYNFPSLEEQQKIADFLSSIDTKIESANQQITQTQSFKKGLLQQMFV